MSVTLIAKGLGLFDVMLSALMGKGLMQFLSMKAAILAKIAVFFISVSRLFSKGTRTL